MRSALTDRDMMPFGPHIGRLMGDVPKEYIAELAEREGLERRWPDVADYAQRKMEPVDKDSVKGAGK